MSYFQRRFRELAVVIRRDPGDSEVRALLEALIDEHPDEWRAAIPAELLSFGSSLDKVPRRLQFLKHLLLQGYALPRVEDKADAARYDETINAGVVTGYFYPHALSLLEAGLGRADVAVLVAYPQRDGIEPWIELGPGGKDGVTIRIALILDEDGLALRRFRQPVTAHYLFPVDNYYRSKFRLVTEYADCGVPMPGSVIIREVCENKLLLNEIAGEIPGLRLARELQLFRDGAEDARATALHRFCREHQLHALVSKPTDAFGGAGVEFWSYPEDREALLDHLRTALGAHNAMLVQERIFAAPMANGRDWNLRQYVLRRSAATIIAPWKRVRIGHGVVNTTRGARTMAIEDLPPAMGLAAEEEAGFESTLLATDGLAAEVMRALDRYMERAWGATRRAYRGSGSNLEADLLALDFMIARAPELPEGFAVYLNEINDFASGGMRDYEILAHRHAFPDADRVVAAKPFSLAPQMLETAKWRGGAYKHASTGGGGV